MKKLYSELLSPVKNRVDNDVREDVAWQSAVVNYLDSISRCLYVIAATLADLDEEEEMYNKECKPRWVEKNKFECGACGCVNFTYTPKKDVG